MKSTAIAGAIVAATMGFGPLSFAQDYDRRGRGAEPQRFEQRGHDRRDARDGRRDLRNNHDQRQFQARGHQFQRGGYVPHEYRARQSIVNDWHARRLHAPPAGHQWMQADNGDYLLVALATGLIANLLFNQ